ncbi:DNA primase [Caenispirillum bisanense]|uniref:DNA primase n=1 Tax=Caenispirillum bisanense TaxID=414052 RepID=UPI0031DADB7B
MALPPRFLDELRSRTSIAAVIGRKVKLISAGKGEYKGLCPFHNERTPSFTVSEDKGFYHCFGCGENGDAITFEMKTRGLSFVEAVELLAADAGMEVPKQTPQQVEQAKKQAGLQDVVEAACAFFQAELRKPAGAEALAYLRRRGLDDATIARFRLGYAPHSGPLREALVKQGITERQMVEAGLLKARDDGKVVDYFRDRVLFPITDRRGKVIAFGGRVMGDGQPKYLNSPDNPLFHKGSVLYNLALAREAARAAGRVIVAEGYMDVIAMARFGIGEAVAPLGTAMTEAQIQELWKLSPEPILCLDGDAAGIRAANKAAQRALPLLKPGLSLRFALVVGGKDPDELLSTAGRDAFESVLAKAQPLADILWRNALEGRPLDTPERRAALEHDLEQLTQTIQDATVQNAYRREFRDRLYQLSRSQRRPPAGRPRRDGKPWRGKDLDVPPPPPAPLVPPPSAAVQRQRILVAAVVTHPELFDHVGERLGSIACSEPPVDRVRQALLLLLATESGLDFEGVSSHLRTRGLENDLKFLLSPNVFAHASFARPDAPTDRAKSGWDHTFDLGLQQDFRADVVRAGAQFARQTADADLSEQALQRLKALFFQDMRRMNDDSLDD